MLGSLLFLKLLLMVTAPWMTEAYNDFYRIENKVDYLDVQISDIHDKMDKMSKQVEGISEKVGEMLHLNKELQKGLVTVTGTESSPTDQEEREQQKSQALPLTLQELRRERSASGETRYVVRYRRNVDEVKAFCWVPPDHLLDVETAVIEGGVEEKYVTVNASLQNQMKGNYRRVVIFSFYARDVPASLSLSLKMPDVGSEDPESGDVENQDVTLSAEEFRVPILKIDPSHELVYEEGQDFKMNITIGTNKYAYSGPGGDSSDSVYLFDLSNAEFLNVHSDMDTFSVLEDIRNVSYGNELLVTLKTSDRKLCGFMDFNEVEWAHDSFLSSISVYKYLPLRPATQSRPFPKDVMGFLNITYGEIPPNICDVESGLCRQTCLAAGGSIFDVSAYRVLPDGTKVPVDIDEHTRQTHYLKPISFFFTPPSRDEMNEPWKFVCTATGFDGSILTEEFLVSFYVFPSILDEGTSGVLTEDGTLHTLELECSGRGMPLPNISFSLHFDYDTMNGVPPDHTSVSLDGMEIYAFKTVTWDTSLPYSEGKGSLWSAKCQYLSDIVRSDNYEIPITRSK